MHLNFRHYSLADGLSSYKVVKVLQDRFGFMWIATQDGLNKFDGKAIIIYNKSAGKKRLLSGNDITDMVEDTSRNILWVISSYGGLDGIDLKTGNVNYSLAVAESSSEFSHGWLKCLTICKDELWIGTFDGITVYSQSEHVFKRHVPIPFQKRKNYGFDINLLFKDEYDHVWVFIENYGLAIYSAGLQSVIAFYDLSALHLSNEYLYKQFNAVKKTAEDELLLATDYGIRKIIFNSKGLQKTVDYEIPGTANKEIRSFDLDGEGNLFFATNDDLFKVNLRSRVLTLVKDVNKSDQGRWKSSINSVFVDTQNNLWLGTLQGFEVAAKTQSPFMSYFQSADLRVRINRAYFIYPYNDSTEYVCAEDGLYRVDNSTNNIKQIKKGIPFSFMFRHPDGSIIASTENQLSVFRPPDQFTAIEKVYPELAGLGSEAINSAVSWGDSLFFIGSELGNGVFVWNYKNRVLRQINSTSYPSLNSDIVNAIYKDSMNKIWILSDNSFAVYDPVSNKIENHTITNPFTGKPLNLFFDVCETTDSYWLASYGTGILQLDKNYQIKKIISTNEGMTNAGVYKIFPVNDTVLYVTSNNGLSKINIPDFSIFNYFEKDGLHSNAFEELCGIYKFGKIYAGGPNGFTIVNPKYFTYSTIPPTLYIHQVAMETKSGRSDTSDLFLKSVKLPSNIFQATVHFLGINYFNPERTMYSYRIKEQNMRWVELGHQNTLQLIGIPPGTYTLQVKAANEYGVWSEPVNLEVIALPKWYQTWWFRSSAILVVMAVVYSFFRIRINQLKKFFKLRTKISQDLHDEIGSTLTSISILSKVSESNIEKDKTKASELLKKITEQSQNIQQNMSDIVWSIRPDNDKMENLVIRMREYLGQTAEARNLIVEFYADEKVLKKNLSMQQRQHVFLIFKEAVNNAVKYSQGKKISVFLGKKDIHIKLLIADDGLGFDPGKITSSSGLKNMQDRAKELKGTLSVKSSPGSGTQVELLCPAT